MDQAERLRRLAAQTSSFQPKKARVVAVTSGKGGVGKTNFAVNVGIGLSRLGLRVGVLDGDLGLANIDIVLGIMPQFNLGDVLYGKKRLKEIVVPGPEGLLVLAGGSGVYELANLSQWMLQRFITEIRALDAHLDMLIIDTGAGISRNVMGFVLASDEVIVVTTPEVTAITDAYGVIKLIAGQSPATRIRVVVNMARSDKEAENVVRSLRAVVGQFIRTDLKLDLLGRLPWDPAVTKAVQEQSPFYISYPGSKASHSVARIAAKLIEDREDAKHAGIGSLFERVARIVRGG